MAKSAMTMILAMMVRYLRRLTLFKKVNTIAHLLQLITPVELVWETLILDNMGSFYFAPRRHVLFEFCMVTHPFAPKNDRYNGRKD